MRRSSIAVAFLALAACTPAGIGDSGPAALPEICVSLTGLPFPERRAAIARAGDPDEVLDRMRAACPEVLETLESLEAVVAASSLLDDPARWDSAVEGFTCEAGGITVPFENPFDDPVRVIVTGRFLDHAGATLAADARVSDVVAPGTPVDVFVPVGAPPGTVDCAIEVQPFLVRGHSVTDTWDAGVGLAPPLPATAGDDWMAVLEAIVASEIEVESAGDWTRSGSFEDVRSKNYERLVSREGTDEAGRYEIVSVCRARTVTDGLALVVYEFSTTELDLALGVGVFTRSPEDGHWRWVHTSMLLDAGGGGCGLLAGVEIV